MNKILFILFFALSAVKAMSQNTVADTLADTKFLWLGGFNISPDGSIWAFSDLPGSDCIIYKLPEEEVWHHSPPFMQFSDHPTTVDFFDENHIILLGEISHPKDTLFGFFNYYYHSSDNGASWAINQLPDSVDAKCIETSQDGTGWIGDFSSGKVLFSEDFGLTWVTITSLPTRSIDQILMVNQQEGYINSGKEIYHTTNNWQSFESVEVEKLQGFSPVFLEIEPKSQSLILVSRLGQLFFYDPKQREWDFINRDVRTLIQDVANNHLYSITNDCKSTNLSEESPLSFVDSDILDMGTLHRMNSGKLFTLLSNGQLLASEHGHADTIRLVTNDYSIQVMDSAFVNDQWFGADYKSICSKRGDQRWIRVCYNQSPYIFFSLDSTDSTLVVVDKNHVNYTYDPGANTLTPRTTKNLIRSFNTHPIEEVELTISRYGCGSSSHNKACFQRKDSTILGSYFMINEWEQKRSEISVVRENAIPFDQIETAVVQINTNPDPPTATENLLISPRDIEEYRDFLNLIASEPENRRVKQFSILIEAIKNDSDVYAFCSRVPEVLDTISNQTLTSALCNRDLSWSTSYVVYTLNLKNEVGDSLILESRYASFHSTSDAALSLPWTVSYHGRTFISMNLETSFYWDQVCRYLWPQETRFHKKFILLAIADELYRRHYEGSKKSDL